MLICHNHFHQTEAPLSEALAGEPPIKVDILSNKCFFCQQDIRLIYGILALKSNTIVFQADWTLHSEWNQPARGKFTCISIALFTHTQSYTDGSGCHARCRPAHHDQFGVQYHAEGYFNMQIQIQHDTLNQTCFLLITKGPFGACKRISYLLYLTSFVNPSRNSLNQDDFSQVEDAVHEAKATVKELYMFSSLMF